MRCQYKTQFYPKKLGKTKRKVITLELCLISPFPPKKILFSKTAINLNLGLIPTFLSKQIRDDYKKKSSLSFDLIFTRFKHLCFHTIFPSVPYYFENGRGVIQRRQKARKQLPLLSASLAVNTRIRLHKEVGSLV